MIVNKPGKTSKVKGFILAMALFLMAPGLAICGFFYHVAELSCSRADDACTIVKTTPLGETRMSFHLSSVISAEKTSAYERSSSVSRGRALHIALHTADGNRHLSAYNTGIGEKKMESNVKEINDFVAGNEAQTLVIRQDDRVIALASLPFFFAGFWLFRVHWRLKRSEAGYGYFCDVPVPSPIHPIAVSLSVIFCGMFVILLQRLIWVRSAYEKLQQPLYLISAGSKR